MLWRSNELVVTVREEIFFSISLGGEVVGRFEGRSFSDEDDLWITAHAIEGDRLVERTTVQHGFHEPKVYEEKLLAAGLRRVSDEATRSLAEAALAKADAAAERERLERERAAAARVAAIPGGSSNLRAGPNVERAQQALIERIERWSDERASQLLKTLVRLTDAKPSAEVLQAYARGCLSACFQHQLPALPASSKQAPNAELAQELSERAQQLERDGDGQEDVDALNNARALWAAAKSIQWAAEQLSPGGKP